MVQVPDDEVTHETQGNIYPKYEGEGETDDAAAACTEEDTFQVNNTPMSHKPDTLMMS